ncbi:MAG TPA: protein phosphatase 2C domain-containing protein [Ktedonobacteraceae bacterium]
MLQLQNNDTDTSYNVYPLTLAGIEKVQIGQSGLALSIGAQLDPGIRRKYRPNEDTILVMDGVEPSAPAMQKPFVLLVVADGMGGPGHGQEASQLAVQSLVEYVSHSLGTGQTPCEGWLSLLKAGVQYANQMVYERNEQQRTAMGTTMTAALVSETTAYVAHVGDSRLYLYHEPAGLVQITRDHSVVAMLVAEGAIAPDDIYTHPKRNQIYRSLGDEARVEVDTSVVPLAAGDTMLLCSDGLWEMVRDQHIAAILAPSPSSPSQTARALIAAALDGGGADNISAIVAQVSNV